MARRQIIKSCKQCGKAFSAPACFPTRYHFCSRPCSWDFVRPVSPEKAFWPKVEKSDGCWLWTGAKSRYGYGVVRSRGENRQAHRQSWVFANGPIPDGLFVCHRCDNPPCVRPDHLFLGTAKDNHVDMVQKGRAPNRDHVGGWNTSMLTADDVRAIRSAEGTLREIGERFGVAFQTVGNIRQRRRWASLV